MWYVETFAFIDADIKAQQEAVTSTITTKDVKALSCEGTGV